MRGENKKRLIFKKVPRRDKPRRTLAQAVNASLMVMTIPALLWLFVFRYMPMPGLLLAFKDFRIFRGKGFFGNLWMSDWVGFKHFHDLFVGSSSGIIIRNTLLYNLAFIVIGVVCALVLAICLHEMLWRRISKVYQTIMLLPFFLSWVVVSYLIFALFSNHDGIINQFLLSLGLEKVLWYAEAQHWPFILVAVFIWKWTGYNSIIYLAAITGIDPTLYSAAHVDGATKWQQLRHITLPLIAPIISVLMLLSFGSIFAADFGLFYQVPRNTGALFSATNVIDTYIFRALTQRGDIGLSAATGLVQSLVGFVLVLSMNAVVRRIDPDKSLF